MIIISDTQQLGIEVLAEVQSAIDDLTSLLNTINQFPDDKQSIIDVQTEGDQQVEDLKTDIDGLDNKDIALNVEDSQVITAGTDADTLSTNLDDAGTSATDLESDLSTIDGTPLEDAAGSANDLTNNMDGASDKTDDASNSMVGAKESTENVGIAAGLAGLGIGALVGTAVNGAGETADVWGRIGAVYHQTSEQAQQSWGGAISNMTSTTGRGAGDVRGYILGMGIVGVKSSDLITSSFNAIASASGATGIPLSNMENTLEKVAATGKIGRGTLQQLGLTTDDIGMSTADLTKKLQGMTAEQRTAYLSGLVAAKYGQAGNETYKESWEHVLAAASRSGEYMSRILGATILPLAVAAIGAVSWAIGGLAGGFDKLNGPMGSFIKVIVGIGFTIVAVAAVVLGLASAYHILKIPQAIVSLQTTYQTGVMYANRIAMALSAIQTYGLSGALMALRTGTVFSTAATLINTGVTDANSASQNTGIFATARAGAARLLMGAQSIIAAGGSAILTAAQWALNIAMNANPIGLIILALVALAAGFIWAYNNIKPVHDAVNWLWGLLAGFWSWMTGSAGSGDIWGWLWKGIKFAIDMVFLPMTLMGNMINAVISWLTGGAGAGDLWGWIWHGIAEVLVRISVFRGMMIATIEAWIQQILSSPSKLWDWLWSGLVEAGQKIYGFFLDLGNYLIALPANMNKWGHDIILGLINGIINAIPGLRDALSAIGLNFPQSPPKEGPLAAVTAAGAESWTSNIAGAMTKGLSKFKLDSIGKLPSLSGMPNISNAMGGQGSQQPNQLQITVDLTGLPAGTTPTQAKDIGNSIGEGLSTNPALRGLITNGGKVGPLARK